MKLYALLFALVLGSATANAQTSKTLNPQDEPQSWSYLSKVGYEFKGFTNNEGQGIGWLMGLRFDRFFGNSPVYMDLGIDFGKASSLDQSSFSFVGLGLGVEKVFEHFLFGGRVNADLMSEDVGPSTNTYGGYDAEAYAGLAIDHGWRVSLNGGYVHTFLQNFYSGLTFGLRLEYKSERTITSRPIND